VGVPPAVNNIIAINDYISEEKTPIQYINALFMKGYTEGNAL